MRWNGNTPSGCSSMKEFKEFGQVKTLPFDGWDIIIHVIATGTGKEQE